MRGLARNVWALTNSNFCHPNGGAIAETKGWRYTALLIGHANGQSAVTEYKKSAKKRRKIVTRNWPHTHTHMSAVGDVVN